MSKGKAIGCSLAAIVILLVSQILAGLLATLLVTAGVHAAVCNALAGILYPVLVFFAVKLFYEKLMHVKISEFGILGFRIRIKWLIIAILLPVTVTAVYLLFVSGEYVPSVMDMSEKLIILSAGVVYGSLGAGLVEEIVFRGVIFRSLEKAFGTKAGILIPSVLFGVVHTIGMDFSVGSCVLVILAGTAVGIMFSLICIEDGTLWCNALTHVIWNIVILGGFFAVSEQASDYSLMTYVLKTDSFAITGGEFGIESSVIAFVAYVIVCLIAILMIRAGKDRKAEVQENGI
ncbi:MAG: CPBP family intramembrane metalloprotease [Lachnospiraceae bacterium]|nr:CPBP family intramembrane metalloprotease [Lachnospiraceae bacterium]